jgi:hypothetical protein
MFRRGEQGGLPGERLPAHRVRKRDDCAATLQALRLDSLAVQLDNPLRGFIISGPSLVIIADLS